MNKLKPGDWVVYRKSKSSSAPGPRAKQVVAAKRGETYSYVVEKYWVVKGRPDEGTLLLATRTGKEHLVPVGDPRLRSVRWWERWLLADRFPAEDPSIDAVSDRGDA